LTDCSSAVDGAAPSCSGPSLPDLARLAPIPRPRHGSRACMVLRKCTRQSLAQTWAYSPPPRCWGSSGIARPLRVASHHNWARVYSTDLNGRSLDMLLRRVGGGAPALVVMQARILCVYDDCPSMKLLRLPPLQLHARGVSAANLSSWASIPRSACPWLVASPPGVVGRVIHRLGGQPPRFCVSAVADSATASSRRL